MGSSITDFPMLADFLHVWGLTVLWMALPLGLLLRRKTKKVGKLILRVQIEWPLIRY